jgi:hypothetical protein
MTARDRFSASARAERYCQSLCNAYSSGEIRDAEMEVMIDEVMGLREAIPHAVWAEVGRLPGDSARTVLASSAKESGISEPTLIWLMAFVDHGETALIGRALEAMDRYILHLHVRVPASIPLDDNRRMQTRRSCQRFYHRAGTVQYVFTSFQEDPSPGCSNEEIAVICGSYDTILTSL